MTHSKTTFVSNLSNPLLPLPDQDKSDITHRRAPDLVIFAPRLGGVDHINFMELKRRYMSQCGLE